MDGGGELGCWAGMGETDPSHATTSRYLHTRYIYSLSLVSAEALACVTLGALVAGAKADLTLRRPEFEVEKMKKVLSLI